ncbi:cytochrome-c oxidase, cbb3-type subunit III [Stenoxybacter acetivorans]|uniref:cytochrome-c oxidase, cbb3-type subunit III n=1 Tax=Stenoxybacter acetivorans TaxID=422441 RepID=UPI0009FCB733|nr:cytochrome-c oxidase, cbb3-type subunit III [Stenoxybacter acetivorans]
MNTSQFTSNFWNIYIFVIVIASFLGLAWLLISQNKVKGDSTKGGQVETMGHSWDGIEEYNNPLPRWWFYLFVLTVLFGIAYFILYPGMGDYKGVFNWSSSNQYEQEVKVADAKYGPIYQKFGQMPVEALAADPQANRIGKNLFDTYCIQCHGSDAKGSRGFPNLTDHDWLWGGTPDKIQETVTNGRLGVMAAWGPALGEEKVKDAANYVLSLSGANHDAARAKLGDAVFHGPPANCFTCHGPDGKGIQGLGPNLTDDTWLWGGTEKAIVNTITNGHTNQMPAWNTFLDKDKIHILTAYVWGLSNKGDAAAANAQPAAASQPAAVTDEAKTVVENGVVTMYFASGKSDLAANTSEALAEVVKGVGEGKTAVISGYHDSTGDAVKNAELAKERAVKAKDALVALGVPEDKVQLEKPISSDGGDTSAGRRVEVLLK